MQDHMDGNTNKTRAEDVQHIQQPRPRAPVSQQIRERVLNKIINTLKNRCTEPRMLGGVETIAQKFEERVFAIASSEQDYVARISMKMKSLDNNARRSVNSSTPSPASGGSNQLHSDGVQSADVKHDQQFVQSKNPSQLQPRQISNSNSPSSQSPNLLNISRMPPNLEKKAPEQPTPSSLMPASLGQDQVQRPQQLIQRNQIAQGQLSNQHRSRGNIVLTMGKDPISLPPAQQQQSRPTHLPYSQQAISKAAASGPQTQISSGSFQIHKQNIQAEQSEVSSAYRNQPVTKQQYESWQRDIAHQTQSIPSQHKSLPLPANVEANTEKTNTSNNQQNMLPQGRALETPQEIQHHISQPSRAHNIVQKQLSDLATAHPQRSAQSTVRKEELKHQTVQPHAVPLVPRKVISGVQQASTGIMLSQEERLHAQRMSQQKPEISVSQNQPRPGTGTLQMRSVSSDASKRIDTPSAAGRDGDAELLRENTYQKIIAMKEKYLAALVTVEAKLDERRKLLDMQPHDPKNDEYMKSFKDLQLRVARTLRLLHLPKDKIMKIHAENLDNWEKLILSNLSVCFRPKNADSKTIPQTNSPQVQRTEEARIVGSQPEQMTQPSQPVQQSQRVTPQQPPALLQAHSQHQLVMSGDHNQNHLADQSDMNLHYVRGSQKNVAGTSSLPTPRSAGDNCVAQAQPPISSSSQPLLEDCNHVTETLRNNSQTISEQRNPSQSPIERLLKAVGSISPQALKTSMDDIFSVVCMDNVMETAAPKSTPTAALGALGQDLGAMTGCRLQARISKLRDGGTITWTPRPRLISTPLHMRDDQDTADTASTSEIPLKRPRIEPPLNLLSEEIKKANQRLIDIAVMICGADVALLLGSLGRSGAGTVVELCYVGVSVNLSFMKSIAPSGNSSLIEPLLLLIPYNYPNCSPEVLDTTSKRAGSSEELTDKARARLETSLRSLKSPFSISDIARTWEHCTREVVIEYAEKFGGGTFSSRLGKWQKF